MQHSTTGPPTPITQHACNSQDRTDENRMEIYFETLIFVSPLTFFCFFSTILRLLFINPQRLRHNVPKSSYAGKSFHSQTSGGQAGRQAGTEDRARLLKSPRRGRKPCRLRPSLPSKEVSLCAVLTSLQPPPKGLLCHLLVSPRFNTPKQRQNRCPAMPSSLHEG